MFNNNLGVFDSGIGGLNVLYELKQVLPWCNFTYFADTKNIPYGTKSSEEILAFTEDIIQFFLSKNIHDIVIACNTVSAVAYKILQEKYKDKITLYPILQEGIVAAKDLFLNLDAVAVLATKVTVNSHQYKKLLQLINPNINVLEVDCTGFVEIAENGNHIDLNALELIKNKIELVKNRKITNIILGCTHYNYLLSLFKSFYDANYINPAFYLAQALKNKYNSDNDNKLATVEYFVTDSAEQFINSSQPFYKIETVEEIYNCSKEFICI